MEERKHPKQEVKIMRPLLAIATAMLATLTIQAASKSEGSVDSTAAYSKLKSLAGEWEADTQMGKAHLSIELIAGGTALVERETGDKMPEMMTVYHLDGDRLLLTHYCMAGNQPRMQAQVFKPESGELDFQFLDATNLTSPNAGHMHDVKLHLIDNDHFTSAWEFYEGGKPKMTETAAYTRVK
jgi:hypothetical protein